MSIRYNFDKIIDRRNTGSLKWDKYRNNNILPMWIADMDFQSPPEVLDMLKRRVEHGVFGYSVPCPELIETVLNHLKTKYNWTVDPAWLVWMPGLVPGLNLACRAFGHPHDEIALFTPVYPPFIAAPELCQCRGLRIPLRKSPQRFEIDFDAFDQALSEKTKLLLWCNPHNPVGRAFEYDELKKVADICLQHNLLICSDEIHCDLILDDKKHIPIATIDPAVADHTITLMAPSKTYNIPGLSCSFAIIPKESLRHRFRSAAEGILPHVNALGYTACWAAYQYGRPWLEAVLEYLRGNRDWLERYLAKEIPALSMFHVEATYLAWINVENLHIDNPVAFFEQAGIGLSDGLDYGDGQYVRLNFGCTRSTLVGALDYIRRAILKHRGTVASARGV